MTPTISTLSPKKIAAIIACHDAGELMLSRGRWRGGRDDGFSGIIVFDLARSGIFNADRGNAQKIGRATLTARGVEIAAALKSRSAQTQEPKS